MPVVASYVYRDGQRLRAAPLTAEGLALETGEFVWVGLVDPTDAEFDVLVQRFKLHPLAVEDALAVPYDHPPRADESVQPRRRIPNAQHVAIRRLAPGVLQPARHQTPRQGAGRFAVEGSKLVDAAPHVATIGRRGPSC